MRKITLSILMLSGVLFWSGLVQAQAMPVTYSDVEGYYILNPTGDEIGQAVVQRCGLAFASVITQTRRFVEGRTPEVADLAEACITTPTAPSFSRRCDLISLQVDIDLLLVFTAQETTRGWLFDASVMGTRQYGTIWRNSMLWEIERDGVLAALDACSELAVQFVASYLPDALNDVLAIRNRPGAAVGRSASTGTLEIMNVSPSPVEVLVNGVPAGIAPGQIDIEAGTHQITLRAPGHEERTRRIRIRAGEVEQIRNIRLDQQPATLEITSNISGADIVIDGNLVGRTTRERPVQLEINPMAWDLRVSRAGYAVYEANLMLTPGGRHRMEVTLQLHGEGVSSGRATSITIPVLGEVEEQTLEAIEDLDFIMTLPTRESEPTTPPSQTPFGVF